MTPTWTLGNSKALAILRISSRRQKDGVSHDVQEAEVRAYAAERELVLEQVLPIIESAKDSENRTKYHDAIAWALKHKIRHLIWYMADREVRNFTDLESMEKLIRSDRLVVHYVAERQVLHAKSPANDFGFREIQAWRDKQLSRTISAKVADAMRTKAAAGWWPGNHPPAGYMHERTVDEGGRHRKRGTVIVANPAEVPWVLREFTLRAEGYSIAQIHETILGEGLLPPRRRSGYSRYGVEQRLKNPFYAGTIVWQGEEYPGKHRLIIPAPILARVQASFEAPGKRQRRPLTPDHGVFAGGWLRCAECGCGLVYDPKKKKYRNGTSAVFHLYRCSNGKRAHTSLKGRWIREDVIWEQLGQVLDSITLEPELAATIAAKLNESADRLATDGLKRIEKLKADVNALEDRENRAYTFLESGVLDQEGFQRQVARIREERRKLTLELKAQENLKPKASLETAQSTVELCKSAKSLWKGRSPWERRQFIERLVSNPRARGTTIEFDWRPPYAMLAKMAAVREWRPQDAEYLTRILLGVA